ncbi:MAG: hypothetical protein ACKO0Z_23035 [Betaproteobacteria bacterium]
MAATHTPGPWIYGSEVGVDSTRIETESGRVIGAIRTREVTDWQHGHPVYSWSDEGAANARLASSAPELLEELKKQLFLLNVLAGTVPLSEKDTLRRISTGIEDARAAIAKATGDL